MLRNHDILYLGFTLPLWIDLTDDEKLASLLCFLFGRVWRYVYLGMSKLEHFRLDIGHLC